jgi:hypothetical protein
MASTQSQLPKLGLAVVLLAAAGAFFFRWMNTGTGVSEKAFFYDLSERRLYVADRGLIPPITGVNDSAEDGVRAVVVSTNGQPQLESTWVIAYLETCAPELKEKLQAAKAAQSAPDISRTTAQGLRLVKRPNDSTWVSLATPEGEQIVSEWLQWGTDKNPPAICTP